MLKETAVRRAELNSEKDHRRWLIWIDRGETWTDPSYRYGTCPDNGQWEIRGGHRVIGNLQVVDVICPKRKDTI